VDGQTAAARASETWRATVGHLRRTVRLRGPTVAGGTACGDGAAALQA